MLLLLELLLKLLLELLLLLLLLPWHFCSNCLRFAHPAEANWRLGGLGGKRVGRIGRIEWKTRLLRIDSLGKKWKY